MEFRLRTGKIKLTLKVKQALEKRKNMKEASGEIDRSNRYM